MTNHGFLGSLSTGALLVGAAVAILVVLGALLSFNGFPGPSSDGSTETFTLDGEPGIARAIPGGGGSFELIDPEPGTAGGAAAGAAPATPGPTPAPDVSTPSLLGGGPPDEGSPVGPAFDPGSGGGDDFDPPGGGGGGDDGLRLDDPVRSLTGIVDDTLTDISPSTKPVGDLLQDTTEPLSETLDGVGRGPGL